MSKSPYSPEDDQELMTYLWSPQISNDPEVFVMYVFPWGKENTPLENFNGPRKWQRKVLRQIANHIRQNQGNVQMDAFRKAIASGRGIGKSSLVSWLILWMLSTRIGSTVIVSANNETQLRSVTWGELSKWHSMSINSHWFEVSATKVTPHRWLSDLVERDLKKGTRYWSAEGKLWSEEKPDAYAGVHNYEGMMVIYDEASGIPDAIWSVASGFFTENILDRYWFAFSNGRRNEGYFYECFHKKRDFWDTDNIDARTVEDTDKNIYEQIISEYGEDSREARVEVYGQFPIDGDQQFISPYMVEEACKREQYKDIWSPVILGVDPAGEGKDSTAFVVRQGRDVITIQRHQESDPMVIVGLIIDAIEQYRPVMTFIDEGGLGWGIKGRLTELRYKIRGVNSAKKSSTPTVWGNMRAQMWGEMKSWLRNAYIPDDKFLKRDLVGPHRKPDSSGVMFLESKKDMKKRGLSSPDTGDGLALTFAFPVRSVDEIPRRKVKTPVYYSSGIANSWMSA